MKIETNPSDDCQLTIQVEVEPERLEKALKRAARSISERVKIPGFRPGKAPYSIVVQHVGEDTVYDEALDDLADEVYSEVIQELNLQPSYPGILMDSSRGETLRLTFLVPLQPQVSLGDYRSVRVPYQWEPPSAEDVERFIETLRTQYANPKIAPEDHSIEIGDMVVADVSLRPADAEEEELFNITVTVIVGADDQEEEDTPFPGFSRHLVGLRRGERKTILYRYPDDHLVVALRGKEIAHETEIQTVLVLERPELNDEFAQQFTFYKTVEELREEVAKRFQEISRAGYENEYARQVVDEIRKGATIKYPPPMLQEYVDALLEQLQSDLAERDLDLETYLKLRGMTLEELKEKQILPAARVTLERALVREEISRRERVEITEQDIQPVVRTVFLDWVATKYEAAGKKRKKSGSIKPSVREMKEIADFSADMAWRKVVNQRLVAIGRGEAPELPPEEEAAQNASQAVGGESENDAPAESDSPAASAG